QGVTQFQILANDVFVVLPKAPRLLIVAVDDLVVTTERRKKTDLIRTNQQLAVAAPDKTANIAADERLARKTDRSKHRRCKRQRLPGAVRVTGPHRRVTLNAGISRARYDVRAAIGPQTFESFVSRARHEERERVSILRVSRLLALIITDDVQLVLTGLIDEV